MVRLRFEGRKLEDLDFWTKSDPYLTLSRPAKNGSGVVQVCKISRTIILAKVIDVLFFCMFLHFTISDKTHI
jgi:hypothetical protein